MQISATHIDEYIHRIAAHLAQELGGKIDPKTVRWTREFSEAEVGDQTLALFLDGHVRRDDVVLLISNPKFPDTVQHSLDRLSAVANLLSAETAGPIVQPVSSGVRDGQTWAAFPRFNPMSDSRVIGYAQKIGFSPKVADWLAGVATQTRRGHSDPEDYDKYFVAPLNTLCGASDMPPALRSAAFGCLHYVTETRRELFTTVEHTDLWLGNVMFGRGAGEGRRPGLMGNFYVVDWRGARLDGYPAADLVRFCESIFIHGGSRPGTLLREYGRRVGIGPYEMGLYVLLSLGRLGMELDQFPRDRYIALSVAVFEFMKRHLFPDTPWVLPGHPSGQPVFGVA